MKISAIFSIYFIGLVTGMVVLTLTTTPFDSSSIIMILGVICLNLINLRLILR